MTEYLARKDLSLFVEKRETLSAQLPITLCTPEMRERVEMIAKENEVTLGAVLRSAMSLFLSQYDSNSSMIDNKSS